MITWQLLAILTPILFVIYQTLSKFFPQGAPLFLINAIASMIGAIVMLLLHFVFPTQNIHFDAKTIYLSIAIGILISVGNFLIIKSYALGATQTGFTSIYYPLLIVYGVSFGLFFWHEKLNLYQILGLGLALIGVFLMVYFRK